MLFEEAVVPRYIVGLEKAFISPLLLWYNAKKKYVLPATCPPPAPVLFLLIACMTPLKIWKKTLREESFVPALLKIRVLYNLWSKVSC